MNKKKIAVGLVIATIFAICGAYFSLPYTRTPIRNYAIQGVTSSILEFEGYDEFGIVRNGIAYFSKESGSSNTVVAFNISTGKEVRKYNFGATYGCAPLVEQRKSDGLWLVIEQEFANQRTQARRIDNGDVVWTSNNNIPGHPMGLTFYDTGSDLLILVPSTNGLHALSINDGTEVWHVPRTLNGNPAVPAVDQSNGWLFYQSKGQIDKINALDGTILTTVSGISPTQTNYYNTVLVNDSYGYYVITHWRDIVNDNCDVLKVHDGNLNEIWSVTNFSYDKGPIYYDGKVIIPDSSPHYGGPGLDDRHIKAYLVTNGSEAWDCNLDSYNFEYFGSNPVTIDGHLFIFTAEVIPWGPNNRLLFKINANTGEYIEHYAFDQPGSSCGAPIISDGKILVGNGYPSNRRIEGLTLGRGQVTDYRNPFGADGQTNTGQAHPNAVTNWSRGAG